MLALVVLLMRYRTNSPKPFVNATNDARALAICFTCSTNSSECANGLEEVRVDANGSDDWSNGCGDSGVYAGLFKRTP